jgi:hypothetical protein
MKPFRVVCIKAGGMIKAKFIKGEIYTVVGIDDHPNTTGWYFIDGFDYIDGGGKYRVSFRPSCFRPVDETFGPAVCEQIEQIIELEETIEI